MSVVSLVILLEPGRLCACGHQLVTRQSEIKGKTYLTVRKGMLVARCPGCRKLAPLGPSTPEEIAMHSGRS